MINGCGGLVYSLGAGEAVLLFMLTLTAVFPTSTANCNFRQLSDELIRDQLIEKTNNPRVMERLLMGPDTLTLEKATTRASRFEVAVNEGLNNNKISRRPGSQTLPRLNRPGFKRGIDGCINLLDDILIHGRPKDQLYHITLISDKCQFSRTEIDFLGYHVSSQGVLPLYANVKTTE
ncbi:hypothetical protein LSAT2_006893 [Lamellibrachia satsuma]|nr:hypothetical protein LSAT2_006893 [Lamellibrachia satsuma]